MQDNGWPGAEGAYAPVMPEQIIATRIPNQQIKCSQIFQLNNWQAIGYVRCLFYFSIILNSIFWLAVLISLAADGDWGGFVVGLIACPLMWIFWTIVIRVIVEAIIAILLLPGRAFVGLQGNPSVGSPDVRHDVRSAGDVL